MSNETKRPFCLAPWVHSHITLSGGRALCCHAEPFEGLESITLESFWNSDIMKQHRLTMLEGRAGPETCKACVGSVYSSAPPFFGF